MSDTSLPRPVTIVTAPVMTLPGLVRHVFKLSHYADLLYTLSLHRIKVRYKQSVLGVLWAVLQPVSLMLIYTLIFSVVAKLPSEGAPYALFAYAAILPWTFFATALGNATNSLVSHAALVTKVYFPREILPLTYVIASFVDFLIAAGVFVLLLGYYAVPITSSVLHVIPIMVVLSVFVSAMALILAALQVKFRDIGMGMPLVLQLWMFATPVVYPLSAVPDWLRPFYLANPMVGIIEGFRQATISGAPPDFRLLGLSAIISIVALVVSYVYFKRVEATLADVI